jgi:dTDP-glucose 4,6-dehydratase
MPVSITRCSNNYGPYQFPEKLIPLMINNILEGKRLPVYGQGTNVRDWLYVEDHCKAIDMVIRQGADGCIYNVGGHNERQNIQIVKVIIRTIHDLMKENPAWRALLKRQEKDANGEVDIEWINDSLITFVADRLGHDLRYGIDPSKIKADLGWYPETCFEEGIVKTIRWNLENRDWVEAVSGEDYQLYYEMMYGKR